MDAKESEGMGDLEAVRGDAERYRWLRRYARIMAPSGPYVLLSHDSGLENPICEEELDELIDAALQRSRSQECLSESKFCGKNNPAITDCCALQRERGK